jgi:hypothetical protein
MVSKFLFSYNHFSNEAKCIDLLHEEKLEISQSFSSEKEADIWFEKIINSPG